MEQGDSRLTDTLSMLMQHPEMLRGFASLLGGMNMSGGNSGNGASGTGRQPADGNGWNTAGTTGVSGAGTSGFGEGQFPDNRQSPGAGQSFPGETAFRDGRLSGDRQSPGDRLSEIIDSVVAEGNAAHSGGGETFLSGAGADGEISSGGSDVRGQVGGDGEKDGVGVAAGAFSAMGGGGKRQIRFPGDKRLTLLVALKPYLSPRRAAAVDSMVRFGKIGELLEGFLPGNGGK